jgi:signal transduction histidine kinase
VVIFAIAIFHFASDQRRDEFFGQLRNKALTSVTFLSDVDEIDMKLLKIIHDNTINTLSHENIYIYDDNDSLIYSSLTVPKLNGTEELLSKIRSEKEIRFEIDEIETIGLLFDGKFNKYIVIAQAHDSIGHSKLNYLEYILLIGVLITIVLTVAVGLFFSKQALQPISRIVNQIDKINISNLGLRVDERNGTDELAQLAIKFNKMLERLDEAFEIQRSFVSNASHELRTPLTALTGQLEVALMNEKTNDPWEVLKQLLQEIKHLNKLSNGLLDLAQANLDITEVKMVDIRIDELLGAARAELIKRNKQYIININFEDYPEERWLMIRANEPLLKSALMNIMDNACKYSANSVVINLNFTEEEITVTFIDKGIGITHSDMQHIFEPFYRSSNAKSYSGHGIGLTLAKKIIELHKGTIQVISKLELGTQVNVNIPHL